MTCPASAPRHLCGFSQTVAHKNFIVALDKLEEGEKMKTGAMFKHMHERDEVHSGVVKGQGSLSNHTALLHSHSESSWAQIQ